MRGAARSPRTSRCCSLGDPRTPLPHGAASASLPTRRWPRCSHSAFLITLSEQIMNCSIIDFYEKKIKLSSFFTVTMVAANKILTFQNVSKWRICCCPLVCFRRHKFVARIVPGLGSHLCPKATKSSRHSASAVLRRAPWGFKTQTPRRKLGTTRSRRTARRAASGRQPHLVAELVDLLPSSPWL